MAYRSDLTGGGVCVVLTLLCLEGIKKAFAALCCFPTDGGSQFFESNTGIIRYVGGPDNGGCWSHW